MKFFWSIVCIVGLPLLADAQLGGFAKKIKDKASQKVNHRVDARVDKQLDKTLDNIEGINKDTVSRPASPVADNVKQEAVTGTGTFSSYDFIPGEKILYAEDFSQEAAGELPLHWNTNGSGEVVIPAGENSHWLRLHNPFMYLSAGKAILPENFTVEFDLLLQLKNNGWIYPSLSVGLLSTSREPAGGNNWLKTIDTYEAVRATLYPEENNNSRVLLESFVETKEYFKSDARPYAALQQFYGRPVHVAIQVQKARFRMWINAEKIFDIPRALACHYALNQLFFKVGQTNYAENQYGIYITNIRLATGVPDTRHKLLKEGRYTTTGILFTAGSAVIRPESTPVLKEIAGILQENENLRLRITGHTSSEGDDQYNLDLSARRAAAVKSALVSDWGIAANRLDTDGKGEKEPIADNQTKEGKSANRRVEFVKL